MRGSIVFAWVLVACGGGSSEPPPATPAPPPPATAQPSTTAPAAAVQASAVPDVNAIAEQLAAQRAAIEQPVQQKVDDERAAREQARQQRLAEVNAKLAQKCVERRPVRAKYAQDVVRAEQAIASRSSEITKRCRLTLTKTGSFYVRRSGSGFRVTPEMQEGIACPGGKPAGVADQDVYVVLVRSQPGAGDPMLLDSFDEGIAEEAQACADGDRSAGLELAVSLKDAVSLRKILAWKATP